MTSPPRRLFVFGLGYTAEHLARSLLAEGWHIAGTSRSEEKCRAFSAIGIEAHRFDRERPVDEVANLLAAAEFLLSSVPPDGAGDPVLDLHRDAIAEARGLKWVGYLSTTGVYGDRAGGWVDETAPLAPASERGARRVVAERGWLELWAKSQVPVHVFRLAGIYGPGRNALVSLKRGEARRTVKPGQVFSRIHVADIVAALRLSMASPEPGEVYNLSDDRPAPPQDVVTYAASLLGVPPPPEIPFAAAASTLSPMALSFYAESKRVANSKLKERLGWRPRYPDYRAGLDALLEERVREKA